MDFIKGNWSRYVDVHDFIQHNYTPYDGDESFLSPPTEKTKKLWAQVRQLMDQEVQNGGVLDIDEHTISDIDAYAPGYICKDLEDIVGLQTDAPLKRAILPFGGRNALTGAIDLQLRRGRSDKACGPAKPSAVCHVREPKAAMKQRAQQRQQRALHLFRADAADLTFDLNLSFKQAADVQRMHLELIAFQDLTQMLFIHLLMVIEQLSGQLFHSFCHLKQQCRVLMSVLAVKLCHRMEDAGEILQAAAQLLFLILSLHRMGQRPFARLK